MVVAPNAPLADDEARSELAELAEVLGADPMEAALLTADLLTQPHPLVGTGVGMWMAPAVSTPAIGECRGRSDVPGEHRRRSPTSSESEMLGPGRRTRPVDNTYKICVLSERATTWLGW